MLLNAQNAIIRCLCLILLRFEKSSFSPILHVFGHFGENCQKCLIGIQEYLWDLENKFQNIFQILGHITQVANQGGGA